MIRAVVFDAVGTLIHPEPGVAQVYAEIGRRHGSRRGPDAVRTRFREAFTRQERIDLAAGFTTSETRERERWRQIVGEVLDDAHDPERCFQELWAHFAAPSAWRCDPDAEAVIGALRERGLVLAMASNFDHRLQGIQAGLPELRNIGPVLVSSEIGVRKPGRAFFQSICRCLELSANEILMVGDDRANDHDGAIAAGLHAVLVGGSIRSLREVLSLVM